MSNESPSALRASYTKAASFFSCTFLLPLLLFSSFHSSDPLDLQAPNAFCIKELTINLMEKTGTAVITAKDIEAGISADNHTPYHHLKFSFSENIKDNRRTFDCNDVGTSTLELWVTDEAGNQSYCQCKIAVKAARHTCGMTKRSSSLAMR